MKFAIATDGSENALRAAKHAMSLVKHIPNASCEVIFIADNKKAAEDRLHAQSIESLQLKRMQKIKPVLQVVEEQGVPVKTVLLKGNPSAMLIDYVNEHNFNGLFVGSRGLNAFQEMVLGSVSHKVMKQVDCPVTIVK